MATRPDLAVAYSAACRRSAGPGWPTVMREAGFFDRRLVNGPSGLGPVAPGPGRRGRPDPPPRKPAPKWLQHLVRAVSVVSGAATLLFLVYQSADPAMSAKVDMAFGLPGAMLIATFAIVLVALGAGD